jgi:hypothetical protein
MASISIRYLPQKWYILHHRLPERLFFLIEPLLLRRIVQLSQKLDHHRLARCHMQDNSDRSHPITSCVFGDPEEFRAVNKFNPVLPRDELPSKLRTTTLPALTAFFQPSYASYLYCQQVPRFGRNTYPTS